MNSNFEMPILTLCREINQGKLDGKSGPIHWARVEHIYALMALAIKTGAESKAIRKEWVIAKRNAVEASNEQK
jgi:hypothetical protein